MFSMILGFVALSSVGMLAFYDVSDSSEGENEDFDDKDHQDDHCDSDPVLTLDDLLDLGSPNDSDDEMDASVVDSEIGDTFVQDIIPNSVESLDEGLPNFEDNGSEPDDCTVAMQGTNEDDMKEVSGLFHGLEGNDIVIGDGQGPVELFGDDGNDVLVSGITEESMGNHNTYYYIGDNDASILSGGDGDDTLHFDTNDTVEGGAGSDGFQVYLKQHDLVKDSMNTEGKDLATILDFDPEYDQINLLIQHTEGGSPLVSSITSITNEAGTTVILNGQPVVLLKDIDTINIESISVQYEQPSIASDAYTKYSPFNQFKS